MPKKKKTAPSGSKRRVKIRRKGAEPAVDPAIAYAIAQAIEAQEFEKLREIVLEHEAQMHHLRNILFDLMIIFREEHYKASDVVSKRRFAEHIQKISATLNTNVPDFKPYHKNANEIDDLDAEEHELEPDFAVDIEAMIREAADDAARSEGESEEIPIGVVQEDLMDEMLERASEDMDEPQPFIRGERRHPRSSSRQPARSRSPRRR